MFVNYVRAPLAPALNASVARVLLGVYALWKLASYSWANVAAWPPSVIESHPHSVLVSSGALDLLVLEAFVAGVALVAVTVGYLLPLSSWLAAVLVSHLAAIHYTVTNSGTTWLPVVYMLVLLAVHGGAEQKVTIDAWRSRSPGADLSGFRDTARTHIPHQTLRWMQVLVAGTYFLTGWAKIRTGALAWADGANLARTMRWEEVMHLGSLPAAAEPIIAFPAIGHLAGWGTILLEAGFIVALVIGRGHALFMWGLLAFHAAIAVAMGIFFFDQFILFALFLPWHRILARSRGAHEAGGA